MADNFVKRTAASSMLWIFTILLMAAGQGATLTRQMSGAYSRWG